MHVHAVSPSVAATTAPAGRNAIAVGEVLSIVGSDALPFIQAQVMSDASSLADGDWQWSGWLNPKGRLVAFFALVRVSATHWLAWLPAGGAESLRERLQRFVFRSKVVLAVPDNAFALGTWGEAVPAALPEHASACLHLPDADTASRRRLWLLTPTAEAPSLPVVADQDDIDQRNWRLADLWLGLPYIAAGGANSEQFLPAWLSLQRLDAFSVRKGCYPGQEIVARMHFLGQSKRAAARIHGSGAPPPPLARILDEAGTPLGDVVWAQASAEDRWQALAVLSEGSAGTVSAVAGHGPAAPAR